MSLYAQHVAVMLPCLVVAPLCSRSAATTQHRPAQGYLGAESWRGQKPYSRAPASGAVPAGYKLWYMLNT